MAKDFSIARKGPILQIWNSRFLSLDLVREAHRVLVVYSLRWPLQLRLVAEIPWEFIPEVIEHLKGGPGSQESNLSSPPEGNEEPS